MAVGELYVTELGDERVALDLSLHIARLASQTSAYGVAYTETLTTLGFSKDQELTGGQPRLIVGGNLDTARGRLPELRQQIGSIAQQGAAIEVSFPSYNEARLRTILDKLANRTLPDLASGAPLAGVAFAVAYPFAREVMSNGVRGHIDHCIAPWRASEAERALQKKKQDLFADFSCIPLKPVRDPAQELEELQALPDQTTWWERRQIAQDAAREADAIAFLESRGFSLNHSPLPSEAV